MTKILILFAHPRLEKSHVNAALLEAIPDRPDILLHDLYEEYPDFNIDIAREKQLLTDHEIIVWHHPFYWYNAPPLLKQWIDMVL
ncbi:MAG: NAD(P)H-dependent oxidoreductase, partial [Ignavibacteria bacterium]|nr:NAD(P)H-dependent oxidoreductase [Ignavibacteria bacterium]